MVLIVFENGTAEIQNTDKLEFQISTLNKQKVKTIFVAKKLSDIKTFIKILADK